MRIYKTKVFLEWAEEEGLSDDALRSAVNEMEQGLIDAKLGGNVVKKRIAIHGRGKRGGLRTLIAFRQGDKSFFMYGFAKNERDNISNKELKVLKRLAEQYLAYSDAGLAKAIKNKELIEVNEP